IGGGLTQAVTFSITAANTENLPGEVFQGLITGATAHNTGASITPQTALDDTARVVIQRPANLVIEEVVASRDTVDAAQEVDWFIYAVVRNTGAATMTFNAPDRNNLRIEINGVPQNNYGIEADSVLSQNRSLTLTGGESDTLRFTVTSTGLSSGAASLIVSLAGRDRNNNNPVSAQATGEVYVRTTAIVRLVQTEPIVLRPLINGTAFVNVDQVFSVKLTVENTGFENVRDVVVRLQTDGPSRILTPEQTISAITARARQEISFSVEADTGAVAGTPPEIFTARVVSALTVQGNQPATILTPLDSTAQVVVQRPAKLSVVASIQNNDPALSTNQLFEFSALVTNSGQAPVDGSGLVRLLHPPDFIVTGAEERSFTVGQLVTWQVRAPLTETAAADLRVQITKAAVDSNSQALAQLGKDADTLTVQVFRSDLRIVKLEITAPAGAKDRTLSTEQEFDFTARLSYVVIREPKIAIRFPAGYDTLSSTPFGETVTWRMRATATANAIPVYLVVTAHGKDGNGNPIPPVTDSLDVTTMNKANLNLSTEISDPPGARDGVVSRGQEFTVTARVFNDGDAGVDGPARLRIEFDTNQGFSTVDPVEKDVNVGSSVQWKFRAPSSAASDIFTIRYTPTGVPADTNSNARAAQTETLERLSVRIDSVQSELRIVSFVIRAPGGATDNGLSTGQQFTVRAQVLGARASNVTVRLTEPLGFITNDNTQQVFNELVEQRDVNWTFQAPDISRLDSMVVTVSGYDGNNNPQALPTVRRSFTFSVVEKARLSVSGEISSPLSARLDGIVSRNQLFTVTARVANLGAAALAAGSRAQLELTLPRDTTIPSADDYSTTSVLQQEITDFINGVATWEIKARNLASTQIDNIRVRMLQPYPKDENTENTATIEDVEDLIPIQTESKTLVVQMLPHASAGPVVAGENSTLLMRLKLSQGNLNSSNVLLRMFTLHVRDRNNAPLNASSVIKALRVVDTHRPTQVLSILPTIPAADSLKIPFAPADTVFGGMPDSVDVVVDIADNNASGSAFRLTFLKEADVDAIDQDSRQEGEVEIIFLDERGNNITAEQVTSQKRVINAANFEKSFYNYPNPFSPLRDNQDGTRGTKFYYTSSSSANIELRIYNLLGELVYERTFEANDPAGRPKSLSWNGYNGKGDQVLNGVYIAILKTSAGTATTKVAVVK
ncbi:MAG: T9SS type A sorting domain-containing protein, partial [bacterium]